MKHSKHDKGPWEVLFEDDGAWVVGKPDERETRGDYSLAYSEIHMARVYHLEANARLIAAAPEMYEALKTAVGNIESLCAAYPDRFPRHAFDGTKELMRQAIARIEGEGEGL